MISAPIVQVAYFTADARAAAARMAKTVGAGPFHVIDRIELAWAELRGEPGDFVHTSAYGQWGDVMMELVQQDSEGPSPFRDMYAPGQEGIHHVATIVDNLADTYRHYDELGFAVASRAETLTGTEFAFIDTVAVLGHMVEIYERSDGLVGFYDMVRSSAQDWDGTEPVRSLGSGSR